MLHKIHTILCQVFTTKPILLPPFGNQSWISYTLTRVHKCTCQFIMRTTISQWMKLQQLSQNTNQPNCLYTICRVVLILSMSMLFGSTTMIPHQTLTNNVVWYIIGTHLPEIMEIMYLLLPYITETTTMIQIEIQASLAQLVISTMNQQLICLSTHYLVCTIKTLLTTTLLTQLIVWDTTTLHQMHTCPRLVLCTRSLKEQDIVQLCILLNGSKFGIFTTWITTASIHLSRICVSGMKPIKSATVLPCSW